MEELAALVERSRSGDLEAYGCIVQQYQDMAYGYACAILKDLHLAEDAAQEAFIQAYRDLADLADPVAFPAWLRRIVRNQCNRMTRKKRIKTTSLEGNALLPATDLDPADALANHELADRVLAAIRSLPAKQREATTLFYVNGYSHRDIAQFLQVPVTTVKNRLHEARKRLTTEVMAMVGQTLDNSKPGAELPAQVLSHLIEQADQAQKERDYKLLLDVCDKALETLITSRSSRRLQKKRMQLLQWRGEALAYGQRNAAEAIASYDQAIEIGRQMDNDAGVAGALCAIMVTAGTTGDWPTVRQRAREGLKLSDQAGDEGLFGFCSAALDLCSNRRRRWQPGEFGGFVLGHYKVQRRRGRLQIEPSVLLRRGKPTGNLSLNLSFGTPDYNSVVDYLYRVLNSAPAVLEPGARGRATFPVLDSRVDAVGGLEQLTARTNVERARADIHVPAGSFAKCWKLTTRIESAQSHKVVLGGERFTAGRMTGTATTWLAPGTGLVKLRWTDSNGHAVEIVLLDADVAGGRSEVFPLAVGNRWQYQWMDGIMKVLNTDTCRVLRARGNQWLLSCASDVRQPSDTDVTRLHQRSLRQNTRSGDEQGRLRAQLALGPKPSLDAARFCRRLTASAQAIGDDVLVTDSLFQLAWKQEQTSPEEALRTWEALVGSLEGLDNAYRRASLRDDVFGAYFRHRRFDKALATAQRQLQLVTDLDLRDEMADSAAGVDMANALVQEADDEQIHGYCTGFAEVVVTPNNIRAGGRACGTCSQLKEYGRGFRPCCLGMGKLLPLPAKQSTRWTDGWNQGYSGGAYRVTSRRVIVSCKETVRTVAVPSRRTVRVRSKNTVSPVTSAGAVDETFKGWTEGERDDWYVPGVGLVKVDYHHANGKRSHIVLADYQVKAAQNSLFPKRIGNRWHYVWLDENDRPFMHEFWCIGARGGKTTYLGFAAYDYK